LLGNLPRFDASTAGIYEVRSAERLRFMDRDARLVEVAPRDAYRFGYRLWIDEKTAMPLKTQLCDERGNVIEQIVFASLALSQRIPDSAFEPAVSTAGFRWLRQESRAPLDAAQPALWSALRLPPGFRMTSQGHQVMPGVDGPVAHLVFSDGVASVSVFVESARASTSAAPRLDGPASVGASAAYSTVVDGHPVTAVGEVPAQTVRFIAGQVRATRPEARPAGVPSLAPLPRTQPGGPPVQAPAFAPGPPPRR
jgi:sigma-E factor negative regulatory protein RseB